MLVEVSQTDERRHDDDTTADAEDAGQYAGGQADGDKKKDGRFPHHQLLICPGVSAAHRFRKSAVARTLPSRRTAGTVPGATRPFRPHSELYNSQDSLSTNVNGQERQSNTVQLEGTDKSDNGGNLAFMMPFMPTRARRSGAATSAV
jgi:hypothetical protein